MKGLVKGLVSALASAPLQLFFIRHGETAWSLSGQHTGRSDLPLTPHGERMAQALAASFASLQFAAVLASPRLRARHTCELAGLAASMRIEPDLAEWDYGDYEGLRSSEIRLLHPGWDVWRDGCPGGETPLVAAARADRLIERLRLLSGRVALFSHGQFGQLMAARWIGLPLEQGRHFAIDPASLGVLSLDDSGVRRPLISLWNARAGSGSLLLD